MKTYNCVALPGKKAGLAIRKIAEDLSKRCDSRKALRFQPHITIRGDFRVKDSQVEELKTELQNFCCTIKPIQVRLTKYGFYPWRVIFLDINIDDNLQNLHNQCMKITEKYRTSWIHDQYKTNNNFTGKQKEYALKYGYHFCYEYFSPHFTVAGNDMSKSCFQKLKKELKSRRVDISASLEHLAFFDRDQNNRIFLKIALG